MARKLSSVRRSYWRQVWFTVCVLLLYPYSQGRLQPDSTSEASCLPGEFANSTGPGHIGCLPCSGCGEGEGIVEPCHNTSNTQCQLCKEESYSDVTSLGRECQNCTECGPSRTEASPCTLHDNTICGQCAPGYFLYIDSNGAECEECSECPQDRVAIHWIECAEAGLPQDQQCAPGEAPSATTEGPSSSTATQDPNSNTTTQDFTVTDTPATSEGTTPFSLPTDRGGFISQPEADTITVEPPAKSTTKAVGIAITVISISFTILTLAIFVSAFGCLCSTKIRRWRGSYRVEREGHRLLVEETPVETDGESAAEGTDGEDLRTIL